MLWAYSPVVNTGMSASMRFGCGRLVLLYGHSLSLLCCLESWSIQRGFRKIIVQFCVMTYLDVSSSSMLRIYPIPSSTMVFTCLEISFTTPIRLRATLAYPFHHTIGKHSKEIRYCRPST